MARRRITLYIDGKKADINEGDLVLMNWTAEELYNPTVIRNSYSQQVTLPGTAANNVIFGNFYRFDKVPAYDTEGGSLTGPYFDPSRKVPFSIYSDEGGLLESGYMKLDEVKAKNGHFEYRITLYGGLGSFFYGLSYTPDGEKKTLQDLDFGPDLTFTIDAKAVSDAWERLRGGGTAGKWDIINFAPMDSGARTSDFDAKKILVKPEDIGFETVVRDDEESYTTKDGYAIYEAPENLTELEAQDLRSYLQRPVVKVSELIKAICSPENNGGYTVTLDEAFFNDANPYWGRTWLTLQTVRDSTTTGTEKIKHRNDLYFTGDAARLDGTGVDLALPLDTVQDIEVMARVKLDAVFEGALPGPFWNDAAYMSADDGGIPYQFFTFVQLVLYDGQARPAGGSQIYLLQTTLNRAAATWPTIPTAEAIKNTNYKPKWGDATEQTVSNYPCAWDFEREGESRYHCICNVMPELHARGNGILSAYVYFDTFLCYRGAQYRSSGLDLYSTQIVDDRPDGTDPERYGRRITPHHVQVTACSGSSYTYDSTEPAQSGATITQRVLFSGTLSPAEYLIGYAKLFGLGFTVDRDAKRVQILSRNSMYKDARISDISGYIDRGQDMTINPFAFDAKWYTLTQPVAGGEFASEYEKMYNRKYGAQRINTGYEFDSQTRELAENMPYRTAAETLARSRYFENVTKGGHLIPAATIDGGKYKLFNAAGDSTEVDVSVPGDSATVEYYNTDLPGYNAFSMVQAHNAEKKTFDAANILLFYTGTVEVADIYKSLQLSDDTGIMLAMNARTPCYAWGGGTKVGRLPLFGRYLWNGNVAEHSLDFGTPAEIDIPKVSVPDETDIYTRFWGRYMAGRYGGNIRVMTCKVNLTTIRDASALLRRFFWYGGAWWVLNAIKNHSFAADKLTECEFVQVPDITSYTQGQNLDF